MTVNYVWYLWIGIFILYIILLLMNVSAVIPDMVRQHIKDKEARIWRRWILLASLVEILGSSAMIVSQLNQDKLAMYWSAMAVGIVLLILGLVIIYHGNKSFMDKYAPKEDKK